MSMQAVTLAIRARARPSATRGRGDRPDPAPGALQGRDPQLAGHQDAVTGARPTSHQNPARANASQRGDVDRGLAGAGHVPPHQGTGEGLRQIQHPADDPGDAPHLEGGRCRQGEGEAHRPRTHGGQIGEIRRQGAPSQHSRRLAIPAEVGPLHHRIAGDDQILAAPRPQERGIVSDAEHHVPPLHLRRETPDAIDQPELAQIPKPHERQGSVLRGADARGRRSAQSLDLAAATPVRGEAAGALRTLDLPRVGMRSRAAFSTWSM